VAAFAVLAGGRGHSRPDGRRTGTGKLVFVLVSNAARGGSRNGCCGRTPVPSLAYRAAATAAARATVLRLEPYDGVRRWLIQGRRPTQCAELIGGSRDP
jgi:hypothetical protein